MTEAEELELLELEEEEAKKKASAAPVISPPPTPASEGQVNPLETFGTSYADTVTGGFSDEIGAAGQALAQLLPGNGRTDVEGRPLGFMDAYRQARGENRTDRGRGEKQNVWANRLGVLPGIAASALIPAGKLGEGAKFLDYLKSGAKVGSGFGALTGLGASESDVTQGDVGGAAKDTAIGGGVGALVGAAFGMAVPPAAFLLKWLKEKVTQGLIKPTEAAAYLQSKGIPLTSGQLAPESAVAQFEEVGQSVGGIGPLIQKQRGAANEAWQSAVLDEAHAPGVPWVKAGPELEKQVASARESYGPLYGQLEGHSVWAEKELAGGKWKPLASGKDYKGSFQLATENRNIRAPDSVRSETNRWLQDQLSMLPRNKDTKKVPAEALQQLRSMIRKEKAKALSGSPDQNASAAAEMLERAEEAITETLEQQLPTEASAALRSADANYGKLRTVERALAQSGDNKAGLTPAKLSQAVARGQNEIARAQGGGGELRKLARIGREVLEPDIPRTGVQGLVAGPITKHFSAPLSYWANVPAGQAAMLGRTGWQKGIRSFEESARTQAFIDFLRKTNPRLPTIRGVTPEDVGDWFAGDDKDKPSAL